MTYGISDEELARRKRKKARSRKIDRASVAALTTLAGLVAAIIFFAFVTLIVSVAVGVARWAF